MVDEGHLTRDGSLLSRTEAGAREARVLGAAWTMWLEDLSDGVPQQQPAELASSTAR
ncbi:hypothetical protein [Streptomyces sp. MMG1533]|uniref:hypothetical protein n=1 Tax=Streptomyces sp. MMG1533 TaxID=1415546 RepID=UPI000A601898|nr:hypothetical protein [Streptomyces sp. MMG1533]